MSNITYLSNGTEDYYNHLGNLYNQEGMYDEAIECYSIALQLSPQNANIYYNRGGAYGSKGNYYQALEDFFWAIKLNPQDGYAYYNAAIIWERQKMYSYAVAYYRRAMQIEPSLFNNPQFQSRLKNAERENLRRIAARLTGNALNNDYQGPDKGELSKVISKLEKASSL